ncbi:Dynamin central region-domain-containing protein [Mucor lusitanicus]
MNDLIELTNKLQTVVTSVGADNTLDLPLITVVGSQSSGKSSVLETLVQRDFLPRGSGIVTRRPLVLQLVTLPKPSDLEYGEFLHIKDKKFYEFSEIREEIERETSRLAGGNKGISRMPIHLRVYSPKVLNLTLVDLPGLTKVCDQPNDIEKQIRGLVMDYISNPNSIILAVTPANSDLVNSDSLKIARQVDPEGKRTIGVLTKLDLMDAGTNALDILSGRSYPLKLGFIGVVNRSQQDILTNKPMSTALEAENQFFQQHPAYRSVAARCGTQYLSKQLNTILLAHIKEKLPELRTKLSSLISQTQQELNQYGEPSRSTESIHRGPLILRMLTKFANDFVAAIDGTSAEMSTKELCGGARIYYIFNNVFGQALDAIPACSNLTNHDIRTAIRNSTGPRPSLFVPELAFDLLVRPQIKLLEAPSLRCVELVYEELMKVCHSSDTKELLRYPRLHQRLVEVVSELLRERLSPTSTYVESLISIERAYINTNHPDFLGAAGAMANLETESKKKKKVDSKRKNRMSPPTSFDMKMNGHISSSRSDVGDNGSVAGTEMDFDASSSAPKDSFLNYFFGGASKNERPALGSQEMMTKVQYAPPMSVNSMMESEMVKKLEQATLNNENGIVATDREELETQLIRTLITSYFNIVRKNIQDLVPKSVMHLLVNYSRESIQNRLVAALYKEENFDELLQEDDTISTEREKCKAMLNVYKQAFEIIKNKMVAPSDEKKTFVIGSRKSQLALVQTYIVRDTLQSLFPQHEFKIETMSTTGDKILNQALSKIGEKALFTKELEIALENGTVDFVVHSLKDLPTVLPEGMFLGAIMERENPNDALVLNERNKGKTLSTLPAGSVIGTSSLRRVAQLKRRYPHLNTRLAKLDDVEGPYSGIILAVAGLMRLGKGDRISEVLSSTDSLHAVSQGALGIECRKADKDVHTLLESLNHNNTRITCLSERALMRTLEGGCSVPIGVNTKLDLENNTLWMHGLVASLDGQNVVEYEHEISLAGADSRDQREALAEGLGVTVADMLCKNGADKILAELSHHLP